MKTRRPAATVVFAMIIVLAFITFLIFYTANKPTPTSDEKNYCTSESRNTDGCAEIYQPVCGWYSQKVQCIKYPCAQNYGNSCGACQNANVEYWTNGVCPI